MSVLYEQIKDDLLLKIKDGTYAEGETIPSETDLAVSYGVSRPTIRQALQILTDEGYIDRRKRRGTVVISTSGSVEDGVGPFDFNVKITSGVPNLENQTFSRGENVRTLPIMVMEEAADEEVASALEVNPGEQVYKLVRLRYVAEEPDVFSESYVLARAYPGLIDGVDFSRVRLFERMQQIGKPLESVTRRLDVAKADAATATLLNVPIGDPLFILRSLGRDLDGLAVEYSLSAYRGRTNSFEFRVTGSGFGPDDRF